MILYAIMKQKNCVYKYMAC